jgi:protein-disulfide isomerase
VKKQALVVGAVLLLALGFAFATGLYQGDRAERVEAAATGPGASLAPLGSMSIGPEDARVTVVEFFDPACETCARFHAPVKQLLASYPEQVRLVVRYAPLHHGSEDVVKMLEAARRQNQYWEVLDVMYTTQSRWASHHHPQPDLLWTLLPDAGLNLDMDRLRTDAGGLAIASLVQADIDAGAALGVRKTPTFFVNGRSLPGFGLRQLGAVVAEEVAAKY